MAPFWKKPSADKPLPPPPTTGAAASTGNLNVPSGHAISDNPDHNAGRDAGSSLPRGSPSIATPVAEGTNAADYFPPLEDTASSVQRFPSYNELARPQTSGQASATRVPSASGGSALEGMTRTVSRQPSIRLRRRTSSVKSGGTRPDSLRHDGIVTTSSGAGSRPRSISQPDRTHVPADVGALGRHSGRAQPVALPRLTEEGARPTAEELGMDDGPPSRTQSMAEDRFDNDLESHDSRSREVPSRMRRMGRFFWPRRTDAQDANVVPHQVDGPSARDDEYDERLVDYLDTIDPEVQTLSTLTNVQNSLFIPDLGKWVNRRPTFDLSQHKLDQAAKLAPLPGSAVPGPAPGVAGPMGEDRNAEIIAEAEGDSDRPGVYRTSTITSRLTESHYAALPHGANLHGWTDEEKWELDDHVRHMMHSRRAKFKRQMKGFGQYVRQPLGFLVTLYATLITLFGLAWVLFLIGWIYVGEKQPYVIHVIDSVLVALFAIMGDGLAPFRAVDTYHLWHVLRYARIVKKGGVRPRSRLQKNNIPESIRASVEAARAMQVAPHTSDQAQLQQPEEEVDADAASKRSSPEVNDYMLRNNIVVDADDAKSGIQAYEDTALTYKQQQSLHHHQSKLAKSHSFYKPHETETHYAFPVSYLTAIVILLDCHSCLQISLGACTWGIDWRTRPIAITTVILAVSITVNVTAGIVITVGDRKTRKKDVWKLMNRQELTSDAMKLVEEKRSQSNSQETKKSPESEIDTEASREASLSAIESRTTSRTDSKIATRTSSKADSKKLVKRHL